MRLVPFALALALAACVPLRRAPSAEGGAVEDVRVRTADGWTLSLVRYVPPPEAAARRGRPVLVLPGLASGAPSLDVTADHSLPRWLAAHGREAWVLSVRGTGRSERTDAAAGRPPTWGFDTLWQQDVRAALAAVRGHTGAPRVDVVGYSLGALLLYAYLGEDGEGVAAAVSVAGPTRLDLGSATFRWMAELAPSALPEGRVLPLEALAPLFARLPGDPAERIVYNPAHVPRARLERFAEVGFDEVSGGLVRDLARLVREGAFTSSDGRRDYRAALAHVRAPVLVVAGKLDRVAPPPAVRDGYLALGGPKAWRVLGVEAGLTADYGHVDVLLGERAPLEVWPTWLAWLDAVP